MIVGTDLRALFGYALLFMAVGIVLAYFLKGTIEFLVTAMFLILAYCLLCRDC